MKVERASGSYQTYVIFEAPELVNDHKKRYEALPHHIRKEVDEVMAAAYEPSFGSRINYSLDHPDMAHYNNALELLDQMYWKIRADWGEQRLHEVEVDRGNSV